VLGIAVGDSEAEGFWRQFLGSLKERGLDGTRWSFPTPTWG
jgi:transposase-like protein